MRIRRPHSMSLALAGALLTAVVTGSAYAADQDYQGTYVGTVTTNSGRQVPITIYAFDAGDEAELTLAAGGFHVVVPATESWVGEELVLSPTVPELYTSVLRGNGNIRLFAENDVWKATGGGTGTALDRYDGSAEGSVERIAETMDPEAAAAWHLANPVDGGPPPEMRRLAAVRTAEGVAAFGAPRLQAPLGDPEKVTALAVIALSVGVMLMMAAVFFGSRLPADLAFPELGTANDAVAHGIRSAEVAADRSEPGDRGDQR